MPKLISQKNFTNIASQFVTTSVGIHTLSNVGVGTTNPTSKLTVQGNVLVSGIVTASAFFGDGSGLTGISPVPAKTSDTFTATDGQTVFNYSYAPGFIDVFLNGIRLNEIEFTASNGTSITLITPASVNDVLDVVEYTMGIGATGPQGSGGPIDNITQTTTNGTFYPVITTGIGTTLPFITTKLTFNPSTGTLTATDINSTSDINLKENIRPIENPLDKILQINGVEFDWKDNQQSSIGVIAQEVKKVFPSLVKTAENKSVNYNGLIGVLIEGMKEQQKQINILMNKIKTLEEG